MAAPSATTRVAPNGVKLKNGFRALITFARDTNVAMWEIAVTPRGLAGGDAIDTTTQHNTRRRTKAPQGLVEDQEASFTFAYDPKIKSEIEQLVNQETTITERFPDGSTDAYYGYLMSVEFDALEQGTMPTGTATIQPTAWDEANDVEADPTFVEVTGT